MSLIDAAGKRRALVVVKLRPDAIPAAKQAAAKNGADDVFFKSGSDTFVASARHIDSRVMDYHSGRDLVLGRLIKKDVAVDFEGRAGLVVAADDEPDGSSPADYWQAPAAGAATMSAIMLGLAAFTKVTMTKGGELAALGLAALVGWAVAKAVLAHEHGNLMKKSVDLDALKSYGEIVVSR